MDDSSEKECHLTRAEKKARKKAVADEQRRKKEIERNGRIDIFSCFNFDTKNGRSGSTHVEYVPYRVACGGFKTGWVLEASVLKGQKLVYTQKEDAEAPYGEDYTELEDFKAVAHDADIDDNTYERAGTVFSKHIVAYEQLVRFSYVPRKHTRAKRIQVTEEKSSSTENGY